MVVEGRNGRLVFVCVCVCVCVCRPGERRRRRRRRPAPLSLSLSQAPPLSPPKFTAKHLKLAQTHISNTPPSLGPPPPCSPLSPSPCPPPPLPPPFPSVSHLRSPPPRPRAQPARVPPELSLTAFYSFQFSTASWPWKAWNPYKRIPVFHSSLESVEFFSCFRSVQFLPSACRRRHGSLGRRPRAGP